MSSNLERMQTLQSDVSSWDNETYKAGQATVTALLGNLQAQSSKMDDCLQPLAKELQQVKKTCHAKSALRRAARWSLVKGWEAFGLTKHWLNLIIEFKLSMMRRNWMIMRALKVSHKSRKVCPVTRPWALALSTQAVTAGVVPASTMKLPKSLSVSLPPELPQDCCC